METKESSGYAGEEHTEDQTLEEFKALTSVLLAFYHFGKWEYDELVKPRRLKLTSLAEEELALLPWLPEHLQHIEQCIEMNSQFTRTLALSVARDWGVSANPNEWYACRVNELDKVRSTLLQFSREWSTEGTAERKISFGRIKAELCKRYPDPLERKNARVLVPGCGLGRLVFDIVKEGFWCQGNELNYHMLLASNFILNHCQFANHFSMFPFLHKWSNLTKRVNQIRPIMIPDINPLCIYEMESSNPQIPYSELMSMAAGSFVDLYGPVDSTSSLNVPADTAADEFRLDNKGSFDVVVTCFFLDTASNIIDYIKSIHYCLKPHGIWINFGPFLWHFEDDDNIYTVHKKLNANGIKKAIPEPMKGLELSREDLINLIEKMGFCFEKHELDIESTYSTDPRSLGSFGYKCDFWVCRKSGQCDDH